MVPSNFRVGDGTSPSPGGFTYQKTPSSTTCVDVVILQTRQTLSKNKDVDPEDLFRYLRKDDLQQKYLFFSSPPEEIAFLELSGRHFDRAMIRPKPCILSFFWSEEKFG